MAKQRKAGTTQRPPLPSDSHAEIEDWVRCPICIRSYLGESRLLRRRGIRAAAAWSTGRSRYVKLKTLGEAEAPEVHAWIEQAARVPGWR